MRPATSPPRRTLSSFAPSWDALERNLIKLPKRGYAAGSDLVYGHRANWRDWGINGGQAADEGRNYASFTGYFLAAGGVPRAKSGRHFLVGALYGGYGHHLDRFSAVRRDGFGGHEVLVEVSGKL
ncbi:MAG: hypothetical protein M0033_01750 [Nitrospiraceae bacterium]|nr:hypothetical protein [Nitrospiraceae bacterium]